MTKLKVFGHLSVTAIDRLGNRTLYDTPNTLMNEASRVASHVLVGDDLANLAVNRLAVGTGTTPPVRADTSLENEVHQQAVDEFIFPAAPGQVEFVTILEFLSSANGFFLSEAGLVCADGTTLFARQVHTSISKNENYRVEYRWRIVFT